MSERYLGEIRMFGGSFAPEGWEWCDGQLLSISQYDALFALIGTTYGGDGINTFGLPNLNARVPVNAGRNPQTGTTYVLGMQGGVEAVQLTTGHLPPHTHGVAASSAPATATTPDGHVSASSSHTPYSTGTPDVTMHASSTTVAGLGLPHENRAPFLGITFIVAVTGIFPSRPD